MKEAAALISSIEIGIYFVGANLKNDSVVSRVLLDSLSLFLDLFMFVCVSFKFITPEEISFCFLTISRALGLFVKIGYLDTYLLFEDEIVLKLSVSFNGSYYIVYPVTK